jgi:hypothetical protein
MRFALDRRILEVAAARHKAAAGAQRRHRTGIAGNSSTGSISLKMRKKLAIRTRTGCVAG